MSLIFLIPLAVALVVALIMFLLLTWGAKRFIEKDDFGALADAIMGCMFCILVGAFIAWLLIGILEGGAHVSIHAINIVNQTKVLICKQLSNGSLICNYAKIITR